VFRGKFLAGLQRAFAKHQLTLAGQLAPLQSPTAFAALLRTAAQRNWIVLAKRPFAGPAQVLTYLSRYTHRVAIANSRLIAMAEGKVTFRWRDYTHGNQTRIMTRRPMSFSVAFCCMFCPTVSYAFATSACCQSASHPTPASMPLLSADQGPASPHHHGDCSSLSALPSRHHATRGDSFSHPTFRLAARLPSRRELFMILHFQRGRTNLDLSPTFASTTATQGRFSR